MVPSCLKTKASVPCNVAKEEFRARKVDKDAAGLADETKGPLRLSAAAFHQYYVTEAERTWRAECQGDYRAAVNELQGQIKRAFDGGAVQTHFFASLIIGTFIPQ